MQLKYNQIKSLFLRQSYLDAWEEYERSLRKANFIRWDYVILTASNEEQAKAYRAQIRYRMENQYLPLATKYEVLSDPDGKRVGSGGATLNVLRYIAEQEHTSDFKKIRILVIHSGGDSKRIPQYSACGKLFSPVPRQLPDGRNSTLFDEFIINMSGVPARIQEGMLVLSGDVLLLFNPLQIDTQFSGAAAISMKQHISTGKNHGVFLNDGNNFVEKFLHKQTEEKLRSAGAVNEHDCVDLDTGMVLLDCNLIQALFSLISTKGKLDMHKFSEFVNEDARISFYGDFLYPLATESTYEQYQKETPEGQFCAELSECREKIWKILHQYTMKLICLSPAEFIHFGTTKELLSLMTREIENYSFLNWFLNTGSFYESNKEPDFAMHNSLLLERCNIGKFSYIEDCSLKAITTGEECIISGIEGENLKIPSQTVLHGMKLDDGKYVVRIYGVNDNAKESMKGSMHFLGDFMDEFLERNEIKFSDIWPSALNAEEQYLWNAELFTICDSLQESLEDALFLYQMTDNKETDREAVKNWLQKPRISLQESFNRADILWTLSEQKKLEERIRVERFVESLKSGVYYKDAWECFGEGGIKEVQYQMLMDKVTGASNETAMRLSYAMSKYYKKNKVNYEHLSYDKLENMCFSAIHQNILGEKSNILYADGHIERDKVDIKLPVRVNWGGGWTDTPPYCNEQGGTVLNISCKINGICPVQVTLRRLKEYHIELESQDIGGFSVINTLEEIQDCHNPYDIFALHKAALLACKVIPEEKGGNLTSLLTKLGGGIYLSTQVIGVPKGSGLGTSSILSGACVKGIYELFGKNVSDAEIYNTVLLMEQLMSTGGGWQDQVGGLTTGLKYITSKPGKKQELQVEYTKLQPETKKELQERFALIYTGQRRLARNLLRDVVGGYIGNRKESVEALSEMKRVAVLMKFELEQGNVDGFAELLNKHWELSVKLDGGSTNTCIEQIFMSCEDLIAGRFIAGAGGGGFLQVILKKHVSHEELHERLHEIFQDSGVDVWDCELMF